MRVLHAGLGSDGEGVAWIRTPIPTVEQVKAALAGHICRCAAYAAIVRTVVDTGKVLRGEAEIA